MVCKLCLEKLDSMIAPLRPCHLPKVVNIVPVYSLRVWQGCLCDEGYEGHDCVLRSCPLGDDPDTHSQV